MKQLLFGITAAAMMLSGAFAQTAPATAPATSGATAAKPAKKGPIAQRKANQQKRIAEGVKSGQLTPGETAKLEHKEAALNKHVAKERAANGGKLTPAEKKHVARKQAKLSKEISKDKHNAATAATPAK